MIDIKELNEYFITDVSQVKKRNYFGMRLVSKTDIKRALCFAVNRREEFCAYQVQKSPVKIKFFSVNEKFANDDILLNCKSSINVVAKVDSFVPDEHNEETILSISQLQKVFTDQIVTMKVKIKFKWGEKIINC